MILKNFYKSIVVSLAICSVFNVENCNAMEDMLINSEDLATAKDIIKNIEEYIAQDIETLCTHLYEFDEAVYEDCSEYITPEQASKIVASVRNIARYTSNYITKQLKIGTLTQEDLNIFNILLNIMQDEYDSCNLRVQTFTGFDSRIASCKNIYNKVNEYFEAKQKFKNINDY